MGLFDSIIGSVLGGGGGQQNSPMAGVLGSLMQGGMGGGAMGGAGGGMGGAMSGMGGGGLGGLVSQFEQAGLGHIAQSWVGNGQNQPVSPNQLQSVFGQDQVNTMANQAGMEPNDFLSQLSQHLPNAVHAATPNGQWPD